MKRLLFLYCILFFPAHALRAEIDHYPHTRYILSDGKIFKLEKEYSIVSITNLLDYHKPSVNGDLIRARFVKIENSNEDILNIIYGIFTLEEIEKLAANNEYISFYFQWDDNGNLTKIHISLVIYKDVLKTIPPDRFINLYNEFQAHVKLDTKLFHDHENSDGIMVAFRDVRDRNMLERICMYAPLEVYAQDSILVDNEIRMFPGKDSSLVVENARGPRVNFVAGGKLGALANFKTFADPDAMRAVFIESFTNGEHCDDFGIDFLFHWNEKGEVDALNFDNPGLCNILAFTPGRVAGFYRKLRNTMKIDVARSDTVTRTGRITLSMRDNVVAKYRRKMVLPARNHAARSLWDYPDSMYVDPQLTLVFHKHRLGCTIADSRCSNIHEYSIVNENCIWEIGKENQSKLDSICIAMLGMEKVEALAEESSYISAKYVCDKDGNILYMEMSFEAALLWFEPPEFFAELFKQIRDNIRPAMPDNKLELYFGGYVFAPKDLKKQQKESENLSQPQ